MFPKFWCTGALSCPTGLGLFVPLKGNCNATLCKDILCNCLLPNLWQQFGKQPHVGVMATGAHSFGNSVHIHGNGYVMDSYFVYYKVNGQMDICNRRKYLHFVKMSFPLFPHSTHSLLPIFSLLLHYTIVHSLCLRMFYCSVYLLS